MIIEISAKQGGGKTTLADAIAKELGKCGRTRYAKVLYEMHDAILGISDRNGYHYDVDKSLLQTLGDWGRAKDPMYWINCTRKEVERIQAARLNFCIIDDLRFKNEFLAFQSIKIRLEASEEVRKARCSQWRDRTTHISEIDLDDWVDKFDLVINTDTIGKDETLKIAMGFINAKILKGLGA